MNDVLAILPSHRWQPTRAGLVGLWRYAEETFTFHRGRLLLRGSNGSGKSMALELLLPFLLDGDTSPARLSSAARSRGRLYDRMMAASEEPIRTGFAWVEFRRGDEVFTVGARLRASQSTGKVDGVFFTTTLVVGAELALLDETRAPISKQALVEAIGDTGRVRTSPEEHRSDVRERLFHGFGADRYASVINALLALRKEKLSQNLDPDKLSAVLSEALPPLDDQDVAIVAEGFERLDRRRGELAALERDLDEVRSLARQQREYARAIVVAAAREVRSAESRRDGVTKDEREARQALDQAEARVANVADEREQLEGRDSAIGVEIDALKDSDAYRAGATLADLRRLAEQTRAAAERAQRAARERVAEHDTATTEAAEATADHDTATANLDLAGRELTEVAERVGAAPVTGDATTTGDPDHAERLLHAWTRAQRALIGEVRERLDQHDDAVRTRGFLDQQVAADEQTTVERDRAHHAAESVLATATAGYAADVTSWAHGCEQVAAALMAALPALPDDPTLVRTVVGSVSAEMHEAYALSRRELDHVREDLAGQRATYLDERARWEHGGLVDPDGPPWRSDRGGRVGAPLWRLVDVAHHDEPAMVGSATTVAVVDGLEAALTAAGLVDAWVSPDGSVGQLGDRADIVLGSRPRKGRTLADLLVPVPDGAVDAAVVHRVLDSIPVVDAALDTDLEVAMGIDGSYRLGSAVGRGPRRPAMLLGAVARERHRLARLAEIDAAIAATDARLAEIDRDVAALDRRLAAAEAELAAAPSSDALDAALHELVTATVRLSEARQRLDETRERRRAAEDAVRAALRELTMLAARHGLPAEGVALAEVEADLARLDDTARTWARRARDVAFAAGQQRRAVQRVELAAAAAERATIEQAAIQREADHAAHRLAILEASIGADYAELVQRVTTLEDERTTARQRAHELADEERHVIAAAGGLRTRVDVAAQARAEAEAERDRTQRRFVDALSALAADARIVAPPPLETATAVLAAARAVAAEHDKVDSDERTLETLSGRVNDRLHQAQTALGARVDLDRDLSDYGWWVLRTTAGGVRRRIGELVGALGGMLDAGRAELRAEEEELFERTLAGGVRRALADRIRQANALADAINAQLAQVRTAAGGVQVRLKWEVDPEQPAAVRSARQLLLRDPADLSDAERGSLQEFVRARVDQARAELEVNAPWEARLRETLDYRSWHRFTLQIAHRDWDGFQPATPKRLARLSTGERSVVLHLPMIASVAAHYSEGDGASTCPRLILLDELFAGVDVANRAQLFGTFTAWDLDAVFTSDSEWCQYATLDGIAIHHLHPPVGDDEPVTSTRFTWDGRTKLMDPAA